MKTQGRQTLSFGGKEFDLSAPIDISIPLQFNGPQPNAYGVPAASATACSSGDLVGDTRLGGSCNFESYTLIPHCNGTHTECIGHISHERISVADCLRDVLLHAAVVSVEPEAASQSTDTYAVRPAPEDRLITSTALISAGAANFPGTPALVVRTQPNDKTKTACSYGSEPLPPYFTTEAMELVVRLGIDHLVVDTPSIDRLFDQGKLSNHRIFWEVEQGSFELREQSRRSCTITELVYVPDDVPDGEYLLNLQIPPFVADAAPSRPMLFPLATTLT